MEPVDLAECRTIYSTRRDKAGAEIDTITEFDSNDFPDFCFRDRSGKYDHHDGTCPAQSPQALDDQVCPFEEWDVCNDQLRWIDTAKFLSCYFRNPAGARSQRILYGFDRHCFVHHYRCVPVAQLGSCEILSNTNIARNVRLLLNNYRPQNRDLKLDGLYVKTRLNIRKGICMCVGLTLFVVLGGKLVWNSWEVVFGAGSFFVAIPMLVMMAVTHFEA
jgi:hypothetical protein